MATVKDLDREIPIFENHFIRPDCSGWSWDSNIPWEAVGHICSKAHLRHHTSLGAGCHYPDASLRGAQIWSLRSLLPAATACQPACLGFADLMNASDRTENLPSSLPVTVMMHCQSHSSTFWLTRRLKHSLFHICILCRSAWVLNICKWLPQFTKQALGVWFLANVSAKPMRYEQSSQMHSRWSTFLIESDQPWYTAAISKWSDCCPAATLLLPVSLRWAYQCMNNIACWELPNQINSFAISCTIASCQTWCPYVWHCPCTALMTSVIGWYPDNTLY